MLSFFKKYWKSFQQQQRQLNQLSNELVYMLPAANRRHRRALIKKWLRQQAKYFHYSWQQALQVWVEGSDNERYQHWKAAIARNAYLNQPLSQASPTKQTDDISTLLVVMACKVVLNPEAVKKAAQAFASCEQLIVLYSDHEQLANHQAIPCFKTAWNPDLYYTTNYLGPVLFIRRDKKSVFVHDNQQLTYAAVIKQLAFLHKLQIGHIPLILYQCQSNWQDINNHHYSILSLFEKNQLASVEHSPLIKSSLKINFNLPSVMPLVSIIIPTKDRLDLLVPCIDSILKKTTYSRFEIIIIDNQSIEAETHAYFQSLTTQYPIIKIFPYLQPFNYSAMNNWAVEQAQGELIALVNNDIEVISPDWLEEMVRHACRDEIACVGAKLYYPDGRIQHAGVLLGSGGGSGHGHRFYPRDADGYQQRLKCVQNMSAVTGACLLVRKALYQQVGGLNAVDLPIAWSDIDLCLKLGALGYRHVWTPYAELYHHESVSRGRDRSPAQRKRYQAETAYMRRTWGDLLWNDPYYSPHLTVAREDFSLGLPRALPYVVR